LKLFSPTCDTQQAVNHLVKAVCIRNIPVSYACAADAPSHEEERLIDFFVYGQDIAILSDGYQERRVSRCTALFWFYLLQVIFYFMKNSKEMNPDC